MTKERLEQFNYIKVALDHISKDIKKLEGDFQKCRGALVADSAKGSMVEYPYIEVRYPIVGVDSSSADRIYKRLTKKRQQLQYELAELEDWLAGIDDVLIYDIFRLRYKNGMTFEQIGVELGYSRGRISQIHSDYLRIGKD